MEWQQRKSSSARRVGVKQNLQTEITFTHRFCAMICRLWTGIGGGVTRSSYGDRKMKKLRGQEWFGRKDRDGFLYRSWMKNQGWPHDLFDGRPVIGICNTWSELTPCNAHFRELAEFVKRGVWEAGGFPLEFPVMSLGETQLRPTAMLFRNLASMDVEDAIRGNPIDGVVLLMGCDKTTPSLVPSRNPCGWATR